LLCARRDDRPNEREACTSNASTRTLSGSALLHHLKTIDQPPETRQARRLVDVKGLQNVCDQDAFGAEPLEERYEPTPVSVKRRKRADMRDYDHTQAGFLHRHPALLAVAPTEHTCW
jgi:hypothetical protein